jgi:predicted PolB exonuclease-like 3'-5' exonuclease
MEIPIPVINHEVVLDIETTGLHPWQSNGITCICAKDITTKREFKSCFGDERKIINEFARWVKTLKPKNTILITANGRDFDIPFMCTRILLHYTTKSIKAYPLLLFLMGCNQFDVLNDIIDKRISLNNIAKLYGLPQKTGNGLQAIELFKQGKYSELMRYCWDDVLLTERVYLIYKKLSEKDNNNLYK